jgi:integrase
MAMNPTYIFLRRQTGTFYFRWNIPATVRPLLGGRTEVKRSLDTDDKRLALRLARRLAVMLDRATFQLMQANSSTTAEGPAFCLTIKLFERLVDGTLRMEGVQLDSANAEQELQLLHTILGTSTVKPAASDSPTLAKLVAAYFDEGDRAKRWTAKTRQELEAIYALMLEIMGAEKALDQLSRKDFAYLKDMLTKLPSNRSKDARYRDKGALELAGMKIPADDLMSVSTINKSLIRVSTLMKFGVQHGMVANNYAEGMTLAKSKRDDEEREPYTDAEVGQLKQAVLTGSHGSDAKPYMKWIPLIAMYSGMRLNEIAQLALADFADVDGIPVIAVNDSGDGKRIKTANSRRMVPVHPALVDMGLLAYVDELRRNGEQRLFPELSKGRDGYGAIPSKWFARFRKRIGLQRDLHALRHTIATKLREADVREDVVADLLGHTRSTRETFGRYASAASVRRVYEALCKLRYGAEVIPIHRAAA